MTTLAADFKETLQRLNLTESEYRKIVTNLGREPNFNELAMFSVLWSEHCCYKNSRHLLKKLPTKGPRVVQGPGENAGVVDVGDNTQIAFKIESHNHPTAVEPFQGAATGVGGILRDIFTMNARPIANLNALRFGPMQENPNATRNKFLFTGAVSGIGHYGNCVGVPTIAGDVFFDECYSGNPLVNAMAIGVLYDNAVMPSRAAGLGNPVLYVGSETGRDGMGGAAFASRELDEKSNEDRPAVQVGDPFAEKLLIEACLEAFQTGCVVAAQDMGAAGLTSSSCEMADKGGVGMEMDLDKVPAREPGMKAFEYLLSESQERMLFVIEKGKEQPVLDVFAKWRIPAVFIGQVIEEPQVKIYHHGELVVDLPAKLLTSLAPSYDRGGRPTEPDNAKALRQQNAVDNLPEISLNDVSGWLEKLFSSQNIATPVGVWQQYDRHVQNGTLLSSEHHGSGVIRVRDKNNQLTGKAIAATVDCNPRHVYLEPYSGSMAAVAEAARNLVCVGAEPMAVTDNLNFGNPEKTEIYYQLYMSVEGIKDACEMFQTPVTGGNVSLYNEHSGTAIYPTPVVGMIGLIDDDTKTVSPALKEAGHQVALVGRFQPALGGSEYQKLSAGKIYGPPPTISLNDEKRVQDLVLKWVRDGEVVSAQDASTGGVLVTLLECAFLNNLGVKIAPEFLNLKEKFRLDQLLFGETNGSILVSFPAEKAGALKQTAEATRCEWIPLAMVSKEQTLVLENQTIDLKPLEKLWRTSLDF